MKDSRSKRMKEDIEKCIWRANEFGEFETSALKINSQVATDEDKEELIAILKDGQGIGKKKSLRKEFQFFR
ncbi:conserved domain protein [Phocaeicola vulgatus PC510]|uniref:Conserved domain protein n=2 Tax=Phocaeicola vulgatus TaxID=821 RepID=D4V4C0_PHOVU|nr:conserved domain protein [Phocaeicola vulgatus PC510]